MWKIAYADFLTALMAFFLVMWLVSGVSPEDRAVIAAEFNGRPVLAAVSSIPDESYPEASLQGLGGLLAFAGDNIQLAREPDGLRIELVDTAGRPLFQSASGALSEAGRDLVSAAASVLLTVSYPVSIEGHTDAFTLATPGYSNWELSSDRANQARRILEASGLPASRIRTVAGFAETRPLNPGQPHLASNRRISLKLHTES